MMPHILQTSTLHKIASLADKGKFAYYHILPLFINFVYSNNHEEIVKQNKEVLKKYEEHMKTITA